STRCIRQSAGATAISTSSPTSRTDNCSAFTRRRWRRHWKSFNPSGRYLNQRSQDNFIQHSQGHLEFISIRDDLDAVADLSDTRRVTRPNDASCAGDLYATAQSPSRRMIAQEI